VTRSSVAFYPHRRQTATSRNPYTHAHHTQQWLIRSSLQRSSNDRKLYTINVYSLCILADSINAGKKLNVLQNDTAKISTTTTDFSGVIFVTGDFDETLVERQIVSNWVLQHSNTVNACIQQLCKAQNFLMRATYSLGSDDTDIFEILFMAYAVECHIIDKMSYIFISRACSDRSTRRWAKHGYRAGGGHGSLISGRECWVV